MQVLIVEDDVLVAAALARAVARHAEVRSVSTVREALTILHPAEQWFAAIVDVGLPDGSGIELARQLTQLRIPTLVLSGRSDEGLEGDAESVGALFLSKPVSLEEIDSFLTGVERRS